MGKNQHYVSQFYLRRFSEDRRRIRFWRTRARQLIDSASIKGQCFTANMYGPNDSPIERLLGGFETEFAATLNRIACREGDLRSADPEEHSAFTFTQVERRDLLLFCLIQFVRTEAQKQRADEAADGLAKAQYRANPDLCPIPVGKLDDVRLVSSDWGMGVLQAAARFPTMWDLDIRLLSNQTDLPFVASDNPICAQNPFLEGAGLQSSRGPASHGIQFIFPLDPWRAAFVFDPEAYQASSSELISLTVADIRKVNDLTFLNSLGAVFLPPQFDQNRLAELLKRNEGLFREPSTRTDWISRDLPKEVELWRVVREYTIAQSQRRSARRRRRPSASPVDIYRPRGGAMGRALTWHPDRYVARTFSFVQLREGHRDWSIPQLHSDLRQAGFDTTARPPEYVRNAAVEAALTQALQVDGMLEKLRVGEASLYDVWGRVLGIVESTTLVRNPSPG